jgi:predicted dehydrogenase
MISIALVGVAHIHTPGFVSTIQKREGSIQVAKVWDHDASRAEARASELGAKVVRDVTEIWDDRDIRGAVICPETCRHEELVIAGARAKKHLFVEKPLGMDARDAAAMAQAVESAGVMFQTGYAMRSWAPVRFLKEHVDRGTFGKITRARASICHDGALKGLFDGEWRWMADVAQAGVGAFGDLATHGLDVLIWLFGEVESVAATLDNGTARYPNCDETGEAILRFKNGVIATLAGAWDDVANPVQYLVSGTDAHAAIIHDEVNFISRKLGFETPGPIKSDQLPRGRPFPLELFLDALEGKSVELISAKEAAYRCVVMEAIYQAAKTRTWITLARERVL